jgi:glucan phosphorylase
MASPRSIPISLEHYTFADFYKLFPEKFNNKTNGVTHRRWLLYSDERLADLITSKIGEELDHQLRQKLEDFQGLCRR